VRIHGIIPEGGQASNVIPIVRQPNWVCAPSNQGFLPALVEKVEPVLRAAALATGATLEAHRGEMNYAAMKINGPLAEAIGRNMRGLGLSIDDPPKRGGMGSVDIGNVSQIIPGRAPFISIALPIWRCTPMPSGRRPFRPGSSGHGARSQILALTALDLLTESTLDESGFERNFRS